MKCKETRKPDPFFTDDPACELIDKIDYDFSKYKKAVRGSVGVCLRSRHPDELTVQFIVQHNQPVVVNVGF